MATTTATRTILRRDFTDALEAAGLNEYEITEDYSGRSMYGATCFGVTVEPSAAPRLYFALGHACGYTEAVANEYEGADAEQHVDWESLMNRARQDSMGRDFIVYFPGWSLAG